MVVKKKTVKKKAVKKITKKKVAKKKVTKKKPKKYGPRRKPGPKGKNKMTDDRVRVFVEALLKLKGRVAACKIAEIDYQTFLNWMKDDKDFFELITRVERQATELEREFLETVINKSANSGDWRAAAWKLEHKRQFRSDYSKEETLNLNDVTINIGYGEDEEVDS